MKKTVLRLLSLCLAALLAYSGYRVWMIGKSYKAEADMHDAVMAYKPEAAPEETVNQSVIDLQEKYPDVAGWLTVPNTRIDYPFVWHVNLDQYLRRDINGEPATAGTLFMDFRCMRDFTSRNTIIYGHNMRNGSMFGTLKAFADQDFFEANACGAIFLPRATLTLEFFAYLVVKATDREIYSAEPGEGYFEYIRQNARHYRDVRLADSDRLVTLSTCSYEFDNARMVLLAKVT